MDIFDFHILPRLPVKSIIRFLFVCKQWQSFLTTPIFTKLHHQYHPQKQLLIVFSSKTPCKFQTIDCESPEHGLSTVSRPLPFEVVTPKNMKIVASTRGVVCVRIFNKCNGKEYSDLILWNPLTGEHKTLSRPNNKECLVTRARVFGLYYSCNDYKVLLVTHHPHVYIYSSKSNSWKKVEMTQEDFRIVSGSDWVWVWKCWKQPCVLLNEKLYFLIRRVECELGFVSYSIIQFDLKTEMWRKIPGPFYGSRICSRYVSFTVVKGRIHLCMRYYIDDQAIVLWRMDGDGDWAMVTYNNVSTFLLRRTEFDLQKLYLMKNGNWLMHSGFGHIYKVDIEKRTREMLCSYTNTIIHREGKYMETLGMSLFN